MVSVPGCVSVCKSARSLVFILCCFFFFFLFVCSPIRCRMKRTDRAGTALPNTGSETTAAANAAPVRRHADACVMSWCVFQCWNVLVLIMWHVLISSIQEPEKWPTAPARRTRCVRFVQLGCIQAWIITRTASHAANAKRVGVLSMTS